MKATRAFLALFLIPITAAAQSTGTDSKVPPISDAALDPTRSITSPQLESGMHKPLPEQYIWTRPDAVPDKPDVKGAWTSEGTTHLEPHYFRRAFSVNTVPPAATLYIGGPGTATAYLNGQRVAHFEAHMEVNIGARVTAVDSINVTLFPPASCTAPAGQGCDTMGAGASRTYPTGAGAELTGCRPWRRADQPSRRR